MFGLGGGSLIDILQLTVMRRNNADAPGPARSHLVFRFGLSLWLFCLVFRFGVSFWPFALAVTSGRWLWSSAPFGKRPGGENRAREIGGKPAENRRKIGGKPAENA